MLTGLQTDFAEALLDPEKPVPEGVIAHTGSPVTKRFAVYRNNVVFSLVDGLRTRFPAVEKIVGGEFFSFAAREFVRRHPPRSPLMMLYGEDFPDFLAAFEATAELPYLADVARLESFRVRAYHAADADALDADALQAVGPEALPMVRFGIHPSVHLLRSRFPAVTIWSMNSGEAELGPVDFELAEDALVMREGMQVTVRRLGAGTAAFITALAEAKPLGTAAQCAAQEADGFDLAASLALLMQTQAMTHIHVPADRKDPTP